MDKKIVSRRDFIKLAGVAAGAAALAACGPTTTPTPEKVIEKVVETKLVPEVVTKEVVKEVPKTVEKVVTATPLPTKPPEPIVMDIWWNTDVPDLTTAKWTNDPKDPVFAKQWYWGGLARAAYLPWLDKHPGVTLKITGHAWDADLRMNQLLAIAAGNVPDTSLGEAYVTEFVRLGTYNTVSDASAALFPKGPITGCIVDNKAYGLPESSGTNALAINLDVLAKAGLPTDKFPTTWEQLLADCQAVSKINKSKEWGNTAYFVYGPAPTYGTAMRILPWFNQNGAGLDKDDGYPTANTDKAVETWLFHNQLMWTSTKDLILQPGSEAGAGDLFGKGVIAYTLGWSNNFTSVGAMGTNAVAVPLPLPPGGQPGNIVIGNTIISPLKRGKNPDMAVTHVEEVWTQVAAQEFLAQNAGIWIPALKSLLEKWETYDKLDAYKTDIAKKMVRVTMKELLGNAKPVPSWNKNAANVWNEWNNAYQRIWSGKDGKLVGGMKAEDIKAELDALQKYILEQTGQPAK